MKVHICACACARGGSEGTGGGEPAFVDWLQHDLSVSGRRGRTGGSTGWRKEKRGGGEGIAKGASTPRRGETRFAQFGRMLSLLGLRAIEGGRVAVNRRLVQVGRRSTGGDGGRVSEVLWR